MKFNEFYYKLLIIENKVDDLFLSGKIKEHDKQYLQDIYTGLEERIKNHNKFHLLFEFIVKNIYELKGRFNIKEAIKKIQQLFNDIMKWNYDLNQLQNKANIEELEDDLIRIQNEYKTKHKKGEEIDKQKENIKNKLTDNSSIAKIVYEDKKFVIVLPYNWEGAKKYCHPNWCVFNSEYHWNRYLFQDGLKMYVVIFKEKPYPQTKHGDSLEYMSIQVPTPNTPAIKIFGKYNITAVENRGTTYDIKGNEADTLLTELKIPKNKLTDAVSDKQYIQKIFELNSLNISDKLNCPFLSIEEKEKLIKNLNEQELKSSFFYMLRKGNYNLVKIFIQMGIVKLLKYDPKKLIPFLPEQLFSELCYYGTNNHILILKELIKNGIDIHMGEEYALRRACLYGHLNIIKELINAGANVKDDNYPYSTSPLSEAIKSGNTLVVKELINAGAEINTKYRNALRLAIDDDNLEMVKFLIDNGADVSIFDQEEINDMSTEMGLYILNIQNKK